MNDNVNRDDPNIWISNWEQQCIDHLEDEPDYESQLQTDRDLASHKAWTNFQSAATAVAQLYRDRLHEAPSLWQPFQTAAGSVTTLYKDTTEAMKRAGEIGMQCGYQRRNKELLNWARKKRKTICREDLISYLAGKPLPPRPHHNHFRSSPRPRLVVTSSIDSSGNPSRSNVYLPNNFSISNASVATPGDENLFMFKEALSPHPSSNNVSIFRRSRGAELCAFVSNEIARNCGVKRNSNSPTMDVSMDSPTQTKRPRYM